MSAPERIMHGLIACKSAFALDFTGFAVVVGLRRPSVTFPNPRPAQYREV
jgi:hypothetical protein